MFDLEPSNQTFQRARGCARVGFVVASGRTRLKDLHQSGCAKAMLPQVPGTPEVVFLNTAGGLTGGDRLDFRLDLATGCKVAGTTQTAERAYESSGGVARLDCHLSAGEGASLDWLPQETILFDRSALERRTRIELAGNARLLFCETLVFGRAAMGETVRNLWLADRREVLRNGAPVLVDSVRLDAAGIAMAGNPAMLGEARAVALLALVAPGAEDALGSVRSMLDEPGVSAEASGWDGRCIVRLAAQDAWPLRRQMVKLLTHIRGTVPPRVWQI